MHTILLLIFDNLFLHILYFYLFFNLLHLLFNLFHLLFSLLLSLLLLFRLIQRLLKIQILFPFHPNLLLLINYRYTNTKSKCHSKCHSLNLSKRFYHLIKRFGCVHLFIMLLILKYSLILNP